MNIDLIKKYFEGTLSVEEERQVRDFFKKQNLDPDREKDLKEWWEAYQPDKNITGPSYEILRNIHRSIGYDKNRRPAYLKWTATAAAAVLLISVIFVLKNLRFEDVEEREFVSHITKQAPAGTKLKFELPDGSKINLNSNSKLIFPAKFEPGFRNVILEGEAYFEIAKDANSPFTVECNGLRTTVLGTSFNVSSFYSEKVVVSVTSGRVKIDDAQNESIFLTPGEQATWNSVQKLTEIQQFDRHKTIAWKEGILIFDEDGLSDIIDILKRWYGVEFEIEGVKTIEDVKWRYSGEFTNESLENVLYGISYVKGFDYKISGEKAQLIF